jgi:putative ABC transport system substrate-binding protein
MNRRGALAAVIAVAICMAVPLQALAQAGKKIPRIGVLVAGPPPAEHSCVAALRAGLADFGYFDGRTHVLDIGWMEGQPVETVPRIAAELVQRRVDLIITIGSTGLVGAKQVMAGIPVVMAVSSYPVERGLISSLSRPGGNITGMATFSGDLYAKRVQLLAEAVPGLSRLTIVRVPGDMGDMILRDLDAAARRYALKLHVVEVKTPEDFAAAFQAAVREGAQAIMTTQSPYFYQHRRLFAELALKHKLPAFSGEPMAAEAGVLIAHGASIPHSCQRAASFVDRILKGAKPADLPAEQATKYELVINLKTARALGLTLPQAILLRADKVVE